MLRNRLYSFSLTGSIYLDGITGIRIIPTLCVGTLAIRSTIHTINYLTEDTVPVTAGRIIFIIEMGLSATLIKIEKSRCVQTLFWPSQWSLG